jgi:hypothetical protein
MKRTLVIIALVVLIGSAFASCAASKGACPGTSGYVGYGYGGGKR